MKNKAIVAMVFSFISVAAFSQEYIVQVGSEKYTYNDLVSVMNKNGISLPDQAIKFIQSEQVRKGLKGRKEDAYLKFFGKDSGIDVKYSNHPEIVTKSKQAIARLSVFEKWLLNKSDKIDVIYLNIERYWDLVKTTAAYRAREANGKKLDYSSVPYTAAELRIKESKVLVLRDGGDYILSKEYNDYIGENYEEIRDFVKRDKTNYQAKIWLIGKMTAEKLLAEKIDVAKSEIDSETIAKYIDKYSCLKMYDDDPVLGKSDYLSPVEIENAVFEKYKAAHAEKLNKIKEILEGKTSSEDEEYSVKAILHKAKLDAVRSSIIETLNVNKVDSWIKANKFPGSKKEAEFVMLNEEFDSLKENVIKENNISFNDLN
jgi:hypothetical protein